MKLVDLTGRRYGRLVVKRRGGDHQHGVYWLCRCDCGTELDVFGGSLRYGKTKSCGCNMAPVRHGMHKRPVYRVWAAMIQRCTNPANSMYPNYGGRGIKVHETWREFENFITNMGEPSPGMMLDRIDNNGDYGPKNCRWVPPAQSARNTSRNVMLTHRGMTLCLTDWANITGISRATLNGRHQSGWKAKEVLDTPVAKRKQKE